MTQAERSRKYRERRASQNDRVTGNVSNTVADVVTRTPEPEILPPLESTTKPRHDIDVWHTEGRRKWPWALTAPPQKGFQWGLAAWAALFFLLGAAILLAGAGVNARYASQFGSTFDDKVLFGTVSVVLDILAAALLPIGGLFWAHRHRIVACLAFAAWPFVMIFCLLATTGWAGMNILDTQAARAKRAADVSTLHG
jgi:hypothetical protein